jgi:capsular polysaccharide biosynthesis protein
MDLLAYFRVLRRHWRLIVAATLVGAALGAASTLLDRHSSDKRVYYRATNTLVFATGSSEGSPQRHYSNPNQIAILTTTGDVPNNVAKKLGTTASASDVAARITTTINQDSDTLEITAVDPSPERATSLADTFASELVASLNAKEQEAFTLDVNTLTDRLNNLKTNRDTLLGQLAANPTDQFLQGQYDAAASNYSNTFQQYLQRISSGAPTAAVSTLEPAQSIPIRGSEYNALLNLGETGRNHFQSGGNNNAFVAPASGSSFNDPVSWPTSSIGGSAREKTRRPRSSSRCWRKCRA